MFLMFIDAGDSSTQIFFICLESAGSSIQSKKHTNINATQILSICIKSFRFFHKNKSNLSKIVISTLMTTKNPRTSLFPLPNYFFALLVRCGKYIKTSCLLPSKKATMTFHLHDQRIIFQMWIKRPMEYFTSYL